MVRDMTLVVVMTQTAATRVAIRILRRLLVPSFVLPPYHAARKQQPITPAFARSLSWKNATMLSNNQERPARLLMPSSNWSFRSVKRPANNIRIDERIIAQVKLVISDPGLGPR